MQVGSQTPPLPENWTAKITDASDDSGSRIRRDGCAEPAGRQAPAHPDRSAGNTAGPDGIACLSPPVGRETMPIQAIAESWPESTLGEQKIHIN